MFDFVVVGAGPSGSRFARRSAEAGRDVLVLERGEIGFPLACSGHVSHDIWSYVKEADRKDLLQNEIRGARFHLGGAESRSYPFFRETPISNVIDRVELDRRLAGHARASGAEIRTGWTVIDVEEHRDHVIVTATHEGTRKRIRARMIAGCDGPVSRVRQGLGIPDPTERLHGVLAFDPEPDDDDFVDVHLTVPRFFAWRIPRGEAGVEYGLAAPPGKEVRSLFSAFIADYDVDVGETCAGAIPIGPPRTITSHRGFLIGDAAAQTKPFTGGGILYGMAAADIAADTIDPANPQSLATYEKTWRGKLAREIQLGHLIRRAYSLPRPIQRLGLRLTSGEIGVHMDRPSTMISREHLRAALRRSNVANQDAATPSNERNFPEQR